MGAPEAVTHALAEHADRSLDELSELVRIPGVSAAGFDPAALEHSAEAVAALLTDVGLEQVEILRVDGAHPYVVGEWLRAGPEAPTALIYAHHDVQPPGRLDCWRTEPFEPTLGDDGRLYGRGVVDDKAGIVLHAAALRAWLESTGGLPVNAKMVVEGEEEIGSDHLAGFLRAYRERLAADVLVLSDTANLATGLPSLTTSLRGLINVDVRVRALDHPLHSGMWGGPVPDAATALVTLLARLVDDAGAIAVPGLADDVPALDDAERKALAALPFETSEFARDAGMPSAAGLAAGEPGAVYEQLWYRPALALTALEGMPLVGAANQLMAEARARVGVRLAPGQDPRRACDVLVNFLRRDPPRGVCVETHVNALAPGWKTAPSGPAFDAARRALASGFGCDAVTIGCGATIPFVGPFVEVLGGVPALLLGLEDPHCNAHGENESLDLDDFRKATRASAHLLDELRAVPQARAAATARGGAASPEGEE
jgi:acetylornithine deacetylase/succinyl-diaminopimelate desuccinylase-like protein